MSSWWRPLLAKPPSNRESLSLSIVVQIQRDGIMEWQHFQKTGLELGKHSPQTSDYRGGEGVGPGVGPRDTGSFCPQGLAGRRRSGDSSLHVQSCLQPQLTILPNASSQHPPRGLQAPHWLLSAFVLLFSGPGFQKVTPWPGLEVLSCSELPGCPGRAVRRLPTLGPSLASCGHQTHMLIWKPGALSGPWRTKPRGFWKPHLRVRGPNGAITGFQGHLEKARLWGLAQLQCREPRLFLALPQRLQARRQFAWPPCVSSFTVWKTYMAVRCERREGNSRRARTFCLEDATSRIKLLPSRSEQRFP